MLVSEALATLQEALSVAEPTEVPQNHSTNSAIKVRKPADILPKVEQYANADQEHFFVITLSGSHRIQKLHLVSKGALNRTVVHPREVFKHAFYDRSAAIIVAHNHPSGDLEASAEDAEITKRLTEAGKVLGIPLLDHVVFSTKGYYSFLEHDRI